MHRTKLVAMAASAAALVLSIATPASAITRGGTLDGDDHPYVGVARMFAYVDGEAVYQGRCSGALIDAETFVTAGHCTEGADFVDLFFGSDYEPTDETVYPDTRNERGGYDATGSPYTHPLYLPNAFFVYDLGVVIIDGGVPTDVVSEYATLADLGTVDGFGSGRKNADATVTAVGYGLQKIISSAQGKGQQFVVADVTRYQADLMVVNTQGVAGLKPFEAAFEGSGSFIVSGDAKHGGTCFGDSGGPMLVGDAIVAVNSFGLNGNCAGIGGVYRIDQADDQDFIECLQQNETHEARVENCNPADV